VRKKILILNTGGTIGMAPSPHGLIPKPGHIQTCLDRLTQLQSDELPYYTILEYDPLLDSANATPDTWVRIAKDIQTHSPEYDGFLVLHGTDTLSFTASALSYMLENLHQTVICTGSQIPLGMLRSDGDRNVIDSLYLLNQNPIPEVCIYFNGKLMRGNRTSKVDSDHLDAFHSARYPVLAESGVRMEIHPHRSRPMPKAPLQYHSINTQLRIVYLPLSPGFQDALLEHLLTSPLDGLILGTYGAGNAPNNRPRFSQALQAAHERGICLLNITQCQRGSVRMDHYATGHALRDVGVISGKDMTLEAAITKLYYVLSRTDLSADQQQALLPKNLAGELS
jgi:L-asparaginase